MYIQGTDITCLVSPEQRCPLGNSSSGVYVIFSYSSIRQARAIAGIADVYRREQSKTYEAGLWKEDIPLFLCWYVKPSDIEKRLRDYRAPSWSWASVDGAIGWIRNFCLEEATIIDTETSPLLPVAPLAAVTGGSITLRGKILPAILHFVVGENGIIRDVELTGIPFTCDLGVNIDSLEQAWYESHSVKLDIWLLPLAAYVSAGGFEGLVLQATSGSAY